MPILLALARRRRPIAIASGIAAGAAAASSAILNLGFGLPIDWTTISLLAAVAATIPAGILDLYYNRWKTGIDRNIPRLLLDLTSSVRVGLSLTRALELAAERDYGPLTAELRTLRTQLSWGVELETALRSLAQRVDTVLARRTFLLLMEAARAGGMIIDTLDTMQRYVADLQTVERERRAAMRPYVTIIYIAFLVFLGIAVLLYTSFFVEVARLQQRLLETGPEAARLIPGLREFNISALRTIFLHISFIQSILGGLAAGKLGEASFGAGVKHIIIMALIAFLTFQFLVPP
jgi:flagellar protein FlaJ